MSQRLGASVTFLYESTRGKESAGVTFYGHCHRLQSGYFTRAVPAACYEYGLYLTPPEVLQLNLQQTHGSIAMGKTADLAIWDVSSPVELCYDLGRQPTENTDPLRKSRLLIPEMTGLVPV